MADKPSCPMADAAMSAELPKAAHFGRNLR
jgi:hypothetical protein